MSGEREVRMIDGITIRSVSPPQIAERARDLCALLIDAIESGASVGYVLPVDVAQIDAFWRDVAEQAAVSALQVFVAERDGRLTGTVQLAPSTKPNQAHRADIRKLIVARDARGRGLGRALMDAAERTALARGRSLLVLDTRAGSDADRLYRSLGWIDVGTIPDYAADPDGTLAPCTFFYKRLSSAAGRKGTIDG